jgi:hypothetical protein
MKESTIKAIVVIYCITIVLLFGIQMILDPAQFNVVGG